MPDPRGILMVAALAPPEYSGAGLQAWRLALRLRARGADVRLFASRPAGAPRERADEWVVRWPVPRGRGARLEKAALSVGLALHLLCHPRRYRVVHLHGSYYLLRP